MLQRLPEADARIEYHLVSGNAGRVQFFQPLSEKITHLTHHIGVNRMMLHGGRQALGMHGHITGTILGHGLPHGVRTAGLALEGGDVIDDACSGGQGGPGHGRFHGINGNGHGGLGRQSRNQRHDACQFIRFRDRLRSRPGGFAADVENLCALGDQFQPVADGGGGIGKQSAIGKGIGRDVDDAHGNRRAGKVKFKPPGAPKYVAGNVHPGIVNETGGFRKIFCSVQSSDRCLNISSRFLADALICLDEARLLGKWETSNSPTSNTQHPMGGAAQPCGGFHFFAFALMSLD